MADAAGESETDFAKSKVDWTSIATNEDFSKALPDAFQNKGI